MEDSLEIYASHEGKARTGSKMDLHRTAQAGKTKVGTADSVYEIQRQLFARSERVKGIDFHPVEPWILTTLYSGMFFGALDTRITADDHVC